MNISVKLNIMNRFIFLHLDCWRKLQHPLQTATTMLEDPCMTVRDYMNFWSNRQIICLTFVAVSLHIQVIFKSVHWYQIYPYDICKVNDISCVNQVIWKLWCSGHAISHIPKHLAIYCKRIHFNIILIYVTSIVFLSVFVSALEH